MKGILVLIVSLSAFVSKAQMNSDVYDTVSYHHEIGLNGLGDYGATSIRNGVTNRFVLGGMITNEIKDASLSRHGGVNRFGLNAGGNVYYRNGQTHIFKKKNLGYEIAAGTNYFGGVLYARDMFGLAMYGNQNYIGDTMLMSGMNINFTAMQKIGFGLFDPASKSSARLNLYNISSRLSGSFRDLEIIQSEDGYEMEVVMDGEFEMAQSSNFNQGFGVGVDLDFRIPIGWINEHEAQIQFKAENIGFGYMYEAQKRYSFDTTISFQGFSFDDLIGENSIFGDSINILDTLGIRSEDVKSGFVLPGYIQVGKMIDQNADYNLQSFFGIRIYPTLIFSPFAYAGIDYRFSQHIHAGASVSYGGFSGLRVGAYGQFNWEQIGFGIGSDNFSGFMRAGGNGTSLYLRAVCRF